MSDDEKLSRKVLLTVAVEATYGVDAAPTAENNSMVITGCELTPMQAQTTERNIMRPDLGNTPAMLTGKHTGFKPKLEVTPAGTPGSIPKWDALPRGAGLARVQTNTGSVQASPPTLGEDAVGRFTYVAAAAYTGLIDRVVTLTCTTSGGTGVAAFTVASPAAFGVVAYNQAGVVMTNAMAFALPGGATITPTITTPFAEDDTFTILLKAPRVRYVPAQGDFESLTGYYNLDGMLKKMRGSRGSVDFDFTSGQVPQMNYDFLSLYDEPAEVPAGILSEAGWIDPLEVGFRTTPVFRVAGVDLVMDQCSFGIKSTFAYKNRVNSEKVRISDRKPDGQFTVELPSLNTINFEAMANERGLYVPLELLHGDGPGQFCEVKMPRIQILAPTYTDKDGDAMVQVPYRIVPPVGGGADVEMTIR